MNIQMLQVFKYVVVVLFSFMIYYVSVTLTPWLLPVGVWFIIFVIREFNYEIFKRKLIIWQEQEEQRKANLRQL